MQEGAQVIICGRGQQRLDGAVERIRKEVGVEVDAQAADVTRPEDIDRLIVHIGQRYGRLDVLVNNAGTGIYKAFADVMRTVGIPNTEFADAFVHMRQKIQSSLP